MLGDREQVQDLTYLNIEHLGNSQTDRKAIFDLYCENQDGKKFIIELQNVKQDYFKDRSIFYSTFPIQSQAPKGKTWDYHLKTVYTIGILNFSFPDKSENERCLREVQLIDKDSYEVFYEKLTFIYLEMPKFKKYEGELINQFDKWLYVLKNLHRLQERPVKLQEKIFKKLFKEAEIAKLNPDDMKSYQESLKAYRDNYSVMESLKNQARRARIEGREEGRTETKLETAIAMKKEGLSDDLIVKVTGLSEEEVARL